VDNEPETIEQHGRIYLIERKGESFIVSHVKDGMPIFVGRVKGHYKAAREIIRWHARQHILGKIS